VTKRFVPHKTARCVFQKLLRISGNYISTHPGACPPYLNKDAGGTFTDRCISCQCPATGQQTNETGLGCYGLPSEPFDCICDEMFCSLQNCAVRFHQFVNYRLILGDFISTHKSPSSISQQGRWWYLHQYVHFLPMPCRRSTNQRNRARSRMFWSPFRSVLLQL
jgi:hypothetical protein